MTNSKIVLKSAFISVLTVLLCLMAACRREQPPADGHGLEIEIRQLPGVIDGMGKAARTLHGAYFFMEDSDDDVNRNLVRNAETIIAAAEEQGIWQSGQGLIELYFVDSDFALSPVFTSINFNNPAQIGALTQYLSNWRLPAWLSAGLELFWLNGENVALDGAVIPPDFGEHWFLPGYVNHEIHEIHEIALRVVMDLYESNRLHEVTASYMRENMPDYEKIATFGMSYRNAFHSLFIARTDNATIYFAADHTLAPINYDYIRGYITSIDAGIRFAKDWLDYTGHSPVVTIVYPALPPGRAVLNFSSHQSFIGDDTLRDWGIKLLLAPYNIQAQIPVGAVTVHCVISILTRREGILSNFPESPHTIYSSLLEDGLAEYLMNIFLTYYMSHEDLMPAVLARSFIRLMSEDEFAFLEETYAARAGQPFGEEPFNIIEYMHSLAIWDLLRQDPQRFSDMNEIFTEGGMNPGYRNVGFLSSLHAAASFVAYLLSIGTQFDFMAFYVDYTAAGEIYGRSIDELVGDWIGFLGLVL